MRRSIIILAVALAAVQLHTADAAQPKSGTTTCTASHAELESSRPGTRTSLVSDMTCPASSTGTGIRAVGATLNAVGTWYTCTAKLVTTSDVWPYPTLYSFTVKQQYTLGYYSNIIWPTPPASKSASSSLLWKVDSQQVGTAWIRQLFSPGIVKQGEVDGWAQFGYQPSGDTWTVTQNIHLTFQAGQCSWWWD